jgi:hypothetical protein
MRGGALQLQHITTRELRTNYSVAAPAFQYNAPITVKKISPKEKNISMGAM